MTTIHKHPKTLDVSKYPQGEMSLAERDVILASVEAAVLIANQQEEEPLFVEIGTWDGGTSEAVVRALTELGCYATFHTIDTKEREGVKERLKKAACDDIVFASFIPGISWEVVPAFNDPIVWAFIDGCHCMSCASRDIEAVAPKIIPGGLLLFHDVHHEVPAGDPPTEGHGWIAVIQAIRRATILQEQFVSILKVPATPWDKPWGFTGGMEVFERKQTS